MKNKNDDSITDPHRAVKQMAGYGLMFYLQHYIMLNDMRSFGT